MTTRPKIRNKWLALAVLAMTQLVVVLDGTIINIALPDAQAGLDLTDVQRQWVVTAYALAFGALMLIGGRIADYWGRKRTYMVGMVGFGLASLYGGLAQSGVDLILARGLQGAFAAMLAPAALALLTVTFSHGKDRNTAFAIFGTVAGAGAAIGLALGGLLTEFADWRWTLFINLFFVVLGLIGGALYLDESKSENKNRFDIAGAVTVVLGLGALVYGFTLSEHGWNSVSTIAYLAAGVVLLALFVWIESKAKHPLLPMRVVTHKVRGASFLIQAIAGSVTIGATLYLTLHLQLALGMSPLTAGLATLPMPIATMVLAAIITNKLPKIGPRMFMIVGPLIIAASFIALSFVTAGGNYFVEVLPALIVMGVGLAFVVVPLQNLSMTGVAPQDAGVASAVANSSTQIGGSIGLSVFTAVYVSAVNSGVSVTDEATQLESFAGGYGAVFLAAAVGMIAASIIATTLIRGKKEDLLPQGDIAVGAH